MPQLRSSNLSSADYDEEARTMTITFRSGGTYTYENVDQGTYDGLLASPSPGKYFFENIKDKFTFEKG